MQLLSAQPIVEAKKLELKAEIEKIKKSSGKVPKMGVVLVGNNPSSLSYINNKKKLCELVGAEFELFQVDENIPERKFLDLISKLNNDEKIDGFIIQMPVSKHLQHIDLNNLINPKKDIDGFHFENIAKIYHGQKDATLQPCTPKGIINILDYYKIDIKGKNVCIIGRSSIVGKPLMHLFNNRNATVTLCHSHTKDVKFFTKSADIIVVAIGSAEFLDLSFLNNSKQQIIIDVGINKKDNKLCGDVNFKSVVDYVAAITPVPGGVGPMTVLSLIENLITSFKKR